MPRRETRALATLPGAALRVVFNALVPLARLLIGQGVTFQQFEEAAKRAFIAAAQKRHPGEVLSSSRLHVLTGIHRRDLARLREPAAQGADETGSFSLPLTVHQTWADDPRFIDARGTPLLLPRSGADDEPSFATLVLACTREIRPRAVLDQLLQAGMVEEARDGRLRRLPYLRDLAPGAIVYFERMSHHMPDRLGASVENVEHMVVGQPAPHPIFTLNFAHLPERDFARLKAEVVDALGPRLHKLDREIARGLKADFAAQPGRRSSLSLILYSEPSTPGPAPVPPATGATKPAPAASRSRR